jgi:hypothetical protein
MTPDASAPEYFCLPGSKDPNWQPSVVELLEWYEILCNGLSDPNIPQARIRTAADAEHSVNEVRHVPPESLPSIERLRKLYEACCRPQAEEETENPPVGEQEGLVRILAELWHRRPVRVQAPTGGPEVLPSHATTSGASTEPPSPHVNQYTSSAHDFLHSLGWRHS